jgi:hypothetical protein
MNDYKLKFSNIVGMGILATSLVMGAEIPTYSTMLEPDLYSDYENPHEIVLENYTDLLKNPFSSLFQNNEIKIGIDNYEDDYPEIDVIEIPVVKRVVFQFNKPVELKFS